MAGVIFSGVFLMLVHQNYTSEGSVSPSVKMSDRDVDGLDITGTVHSGIKTGSDGVLSTIQSNGGFSAVSGEWLLSGASSGFWIQRTILSGTLEIDTGGGFKIMNVDRVYDNQKASVGVKVTEVFFEISTDASGIPVVESATMTFTSLRESGA